MLEYTITKIRAIRVICVIRDSDNGCYILLPSAFQIFIEPLYRLAFTYRREFLSDFRENRSPNIEFVVGILGHHQTKPLSVVGRDDVLGWNV